MTTMTADFHAAPTTTTTADYVRSIWTRIATAMAAAIARAKARHDYRKMMQREDHILADMGVTRDEIRHAYLNVGGRIC